MRKQHFWLLWLALLCMPLTAHANANEQLRKLYQTGYKAYASQQFDKAKAAFMKLLPLLERTQKRERKPNTKAWHMMTFGQFDVLYHLAQIANADKKARLSCRYFNRAQKKVKTIPKTWTTWKVSPNIPVRLKETREKLIQQCKRVPSILTFEGLPAKSTIEQLQGPKKWTKINGKKLPVLTKATTLKFRAPGYQTKIVKGVKVPRWQTKTLKVTLKKQPKPRMVARIKPRPKPRKLPRTVVPVYKKGWFWAVVGIGVAGATAAVVGGVIASQGPPPDTLAGPIRAW